MLGLITSNRANGVLSFVNLLRRSDFLADLIQQLILTEQMGLRRKKGCCARGNNVRAQGKHVAWQICGQANTGATNRQACFRTKIAYRMWPMQLKW